MAARKKRPSPRPRASVAADSDRSRGTAAKTKRPRSREADAGSLVEYHRKRDFRKTPEPADAKGRRRKAVDAIFVVQKHDATHLHYDVRLEIGGVLKSWAVPKGPSTNPGDKRLAVETEDHPMGYADFEGVIPEDEYGGGTVIVWDKGTLRNLKNDKLGNEVPLPKCHANGQIEVWLEGTKLHGGYAFVRTRMGGRKKNWLFIKMKDEGADASRDVVSQEPKSALTGRTLEEVAAGKPARRGKRSGLD